MKHKVYVFCPAKIVSGGPEALHQLVDGINTLGGNAAVVYTQGDLMASKRFSVPTRYRCYEVPVITQQEIEYEDANVFVVPESSPKLIETVKKGKVCLWWLSVGFRDKSFDLSLLEGVQHLFQSEYARLFLKQKFRNAELQPLSDYVVCAPFTSKEKLNKIAIVERKLDKRYQSAMDHIKSVFDVTEIKGLSRHRLKKLLSSTKVFVDFGTHPGKDRLPREAAVLGNIILTSKLGACANDKDVPLSDEYKLEIDVTTTEIEKRITSFFKHYDIHIEDFKGYCAGIHKEKQIFFSEINHVFELGLSQTEVSHAVNNHDLKAYSNAERIAESSVGLFLKKIRDFVWEKWHST